MMETMNSLAAVPLLDVIVDVVRFPAWWYSTGLAAVGRWWAVKLGDANDVLAIRVMAQNLTRPMYGDFSREGRLISFVLRLIWIVVASALFLVWFLLMSAFVVGYLLLLPGSIAFIAYSFTNG